MQTNYHNTTNLHGEEIKNAHVKAHTQKVKVLELYKSGKEYTASDIWIILCGPATNTPITSIRRAITDLTNENKLVKTANMKIGMYSKPESFYKLNTSTTRKF